MPAPRIVDALLLVLLVAAGCGTTSSSKSPATGAFASVLAEIPPDGSVSLRTALEAFSLEFAPLPGVSLPSGSRSDVPPTGGEAVRWLVAHRFELSPAQRVTAERWIGTVGASGLPAGVAARAAAPARVELMAYGGTSQDQALIAQATQLANDAGAYIGSHLGGLQVTVSDVQLATQLDPHQSPTTLAWAVPYEPSGCIVHVAPLLRDRLVSDPKLARSAITHEVFHCAQAQLMGPGYYGTVSSIGKAVNGARGSWLLEGSAEWVGETYAGGSSASDHWWLLYLYDPGPGRSLFARSYDAIGFFARMAETGADPWTRFRQMFAAGADDREAFARAGATAPAFLESWAAGYAREPDWGNGWDVAGPGLGPAPADRYTPRTFTIAPDQKPFTREVSAYTNLAVELDLQSDLTTFSLPLNGRLHMDMGKVSSASDLDGKTFCTRKGGDCTVPGCSTPAPPPFPGGKGYLAVSGGTTGGEVSVTGTQLSPGKCQPNQPAPEPTPTSSGNGRTGTTDLCSRISAAEISRVMGASFMQPEATGGDETNPASGVCTSSAAGGPISINFAYVPNGAAALGSSGAGSETITNLGDRAWCSDWAPGGKAVRVVRGGAALVVVTDTCAHSEAIARILLRRL